MSDVSKKPHVKNSASAQEMEKLEKQFDQFDAEVKEMTLDRLNAAPKEETEQQTKLSTRELQKANAQYLKPIRVISSKEKFNEKFRTEFEFQKQYVNFIAENKELIGEDIDLWTKPFAGVPAEEWKVPTNKSIWGPRYLAEQIKRKYYHRLVMKDVPREVTGMGTMTGQMAADTTIQRLDAIPVKAGRSVFMGAENF